MTRSAIRRKNSAHMESPGRIVVVLLVYTLALLGSVTVASPPVAIAVSLGVSAATAAYLFRPKRKLALPTLDRNPSRVSRASIAVITLDHRGRIKNWSHVAESLTGYGPEEVVEEHVSLLYPHMDREEGLPETLLSQSRKKGYVDEEGWRARKNGSHFWAHELITPLTDSSGNHVGFSVYLNDMTTSRAAKEKQGTSDRHFHEFLETSSEVMMTVDSQWSIVEFNTMAEDTLLYARGDVMNRNIDMLFCSNDALVDLSKEIAREGHATHTVDFRKRGGDVLTCLLRARAVKNDSGETLGVVIAARETHTTGQQVEQPGSDEDFHRLIDGTGGVVWRADRETLRYSFVSRQVEKILGYPVGRWLEDADLWSRHLHPEDRTRVLECVRQDNTGGSFDLEYRMLAADGHVVWIHDTFVQNGKGSLVGVMTDITREKRIERHLRVSREQLKALIARFESIREEERTRIAREIHDELGQILTSVKMDLSLLGRRLDDKDIVSVMQLKDQIRVMSETVDAAIESIRTIATELRPEVLDDLGLASAIVWQAHEFEVKTGIRCVVDARMREKAVEKDRATAIFRIFQETLTNIVRHAGATSVQVSLIDDEDAVTLEVLDDGKGMSEQDHLRPGSLGLIGMRERASLIGGTVTIGSRHGSGTLVTLRIPKEAPASRVVIQPPPLYDHNSEPEAGKLFDHG